MPDETALCLYAGLVTDTGSSSTRPPPRRRSRVAATLREHPFDHARPGAGALRGQPGVLPAAGGHGARAARARRGRRPGLDLPHAVGPARSGGPPGGDRRPDRRDPHRARRGRRGDREAAEGRTLQGERALARRSRPRRGRGDLRWRWAPARGRLHLGARAGRDDRPADRGRCAASPSRRDLRRRPRAPTGSC